MEQTAIGTSGLNPSRIGLRTWVIGSRRYGGIDEARSITTIRSALEWGVTLIDIAPVHGFGCSEESVGKVLAEGRLASQGADRQQSPPRVEGRWDVSRLSSSAHRQGG